MAYRMIQVGTGGFGRCWCETFLPPNVADGLIEVVAAVDINADNLKNAQEHLGLTADRCYTDINKAFDENRADFCTVVVPPALHESVVDVALAHGLHILSEKPIADTLEASCRIAEKVKRAGVKMGVDMSHRFRQDIATLRHEIESGRHGALDYLICRFTCDNREIGTWGASRYEMEDPLIIDGAVHHLDLLADMTGAYCERIYAETWNPTWGDFAGDAQAMVVMHGENGKRAFYEGAKNNAVGLNWWTKEYIRAECEKATLILDQAQIERFDYISGTPQNNIQPGQGKMVPLLEQPKWTTTWLIEKFVHWLDGGEPMETNVEDNLQSVALTCAAIKSSRSGESVRVQELLKETRAAVNLS